MSQSVQDRVSQSLKASPLKVTELSKKIGVSRKTLYRWMNKEIDKFDEDKLKRLSRVVRVNYDWLLYGDEPNDEEKRIKEIRHHVAEAGESYKGLDQTLSNVESKARNLIQDLQSLLDDLEKVRSDD